MADNPTRSLDILEKIIEQTPASEVRLLNHLAALRDALLTDGKERESTQRLIEEYEEAYNKLTAPANRIGVFLKWLDEKLALIALGETEFVSQVDPKLEPEQLQTGVRVKLNDAYAIVGHLEVGTGGPLVKVTETLGDGRIRVGNETPGSDGRIIIRSQNLAETTIEKGDEVRVDPTGRVAVEHFAHQESRDYFFEEVPEI